MMGAADFYDLVDDMTHGAWECIPDAIVADMALADKCSDVIERINDAIAAIMADVLPKGESE